MKDSLKWSITGGIVGILIVASGAIIMDRLFSKMVELRIDWVIGLSIPFVSGILIWYVKTTDKRKEKETEEIYEAIELKANQVELDAVKSELKDHKENNHQSYNILSRKVEGIDRKVELIDKKVDKLIDKLIDKATL